MALPHKRHLHWRARLSQHWCAWARVALFQRSLESRWLVWLRRLCCLSLRRRLSISSHPLVLAACMFHSSVDAKLLCNKKKSKKNMFFGGGETAMCKYAQRKVCQVAFREVVWTESLKWVNVRSPSETALSSRTGTSTWISIVSSHEGLTTWLCFSQIKSGCHFFFFKVVIRRCTNKSWVTDWNIWNGR